jgi:hypothetical protein
VWAFYNLLEQFLTFGPSIPEPDLWSSRAWGETKRTSIKTLDLDVITIDFSMLKEFPTNGNFHLVFSELLNSHTEFSISG